MTPVLAVIAAVARNGVIGRDGSIPWHLPEDLARFRALTWGKPLIIGRRTFQSIGRALPGRETIVVTGDRRFSAAGATIVHHVDTALELGLVWARGRGVPEAMIGGGGAIYAATIDRAERAYVTFVETSPNGGIRFPALDPSVWHETARSPLIAGPPGQPAFSFVDLSRRRRGSSP